MSATVERIEQFFERGLFARRRLWLAVFAVVSVLMGWQASQIRPDASFAKMVPAHHPFIQNYLQFENELRPLANTLRIAVVNQKGSIYDAGYIALIRQITEEVFYIPGIDRGTCARSRRRTACGSRPPRTACAPAASCRRRSRAMRTTWPTCATTSSRPG